jgi:hypothetical protein
MFKPITALAAIALIAGAVAVSGLTAKVEASTPPAAAKGDRLDIRPTGPACSQHAWPYYEAKCMRDRMQPLRQAREVRLVSVERRPTQIDE